MQQYFVPIEQFNGSEVLITGEDARHIQRVMRMAVKDTLICADNKGGAFLCEIKQFDGPHVRAGILSVFDGLQELPVHVTIAQGIPKGDKFDMIVQKGTECGARSFIPFEAERSVAKWHDSKREKKRLRLGKIAKEASEQSHRAYVPTIEQPMALDELIRYSEPFNFKAVAYEETAKAGNQSGLPAIFNRMSPGESLLVVIGPEGGLSPAEAECFGEAGFCFCGLGRRILRTETAALYLLASASYHFELLNNEVGL